MSLRRSERTLPTNLLYRSVDPEKYEKKRKLRAKRRQEALARIPARQSEVLVGQRWFMPIHPEYGCHWDVVRVSGPGTVELRGVQDKLGFNWSFMSWYTGVDDLVRLGTLLTAPPVGVIPDTLGSGGQTTPA